MMSTNATERLSTGKHTVKVRVQVVGMKSFTLDLVLPDYLPASDVGQRIARDAGLDSHWSDGRRRSYWLRARGRLLGHHETLANLGVVDGELVYLLPEPEPGAGVAEQPPAYPPETTSPSWSLPRVVVSVLLVMAFSLGWGIALVQDRGLASNVLPGMALGALCTSLARHLQNRRASSVQVLLTGLLIFGISSALAFSAPLLFGGLPPAQLYVQILPGIMAGMVGALMGWLAWWGAVEPLPSASPGMATQQDESVSTRLVCAICGQTVTAQVHKPCPHGCGKHFHVGCYNARLSVYRGQSRRCAVCQQVLPR